MSTSPTFTLSEMPREQKGKTRVQRCDPAMAGMLRESVREGLQPHLEKNHSLPPTLSQSVAMEYFRVSRMIMCNS